MGASSGSRASTEPCSTVSALTGFDPARWRTDALPFGKRPYRQFIWISGERFHSGMRWRRDWWGLAFIRPDDADDSRLGYRDEDIERLEAEGDMDAGSAEIYGWLPAVPPALLDMARRIAIGVNAASADTRPQGGDATEIAAPASPSGAVPHEDAADAQPTESSGS